MVEVPSAEQGFDHGYAGRCPIAYQLNQLSFGEFAGHGCRRSFLDLSDANGEGRLDQLGTPLHGFDGVEGFFLVRAGGKEGVGLCRATFLPEKAQTRAS